MQKNKDVKNDSNKEITIDFGTRKIGSQNLSKVITIPKTALSNCGCNEITKANVKLVQKDGEKFIKITPLDCDHMPKKGKTK